MAYFSFRTEPFYTTPYGAAYLGDALDYLRQMEPETVDLIVTSPPFALKRKKEYGNVEAEDYVPWFLDFALEFKSEHFAKDNRGSIPPNLLILANTDSNSIYLRECRRRGIKPHPARFPHGLPEFFIKFLTDPGDLVLDPFAGSNVTGEVAERLGRRWLAFELVEEYLEASKFRFTDLHQQLPLFAEQGEEVKTLKTETSQKTSQMALLEPSEGYETSPTGNRGKDQDS